MAICPHDPERQEEARSIAEHPLFQRLEGATFGEIARWIDDNVTDMASARQLLKLLTIFVAYRVRRGDLL